jgi:hypothetical protein
MAGAELDIRGIAAEGLWPTEYVMDRIRDAQLKSDVFIAELPCIGLALQCVPAPHCCRVHRL